MAVTVTWREYNGTQTPGSGGGMAGSTLATNINFGNTDAANLTPASYPIAAGSNSYAKYLRMRFSGSYTQISNIKIHKSAGTYVTGETIQFSGSVVKTAAAPDTNLAWALTKAIPTSLPPSANVGIRGLTTHTIPYSGQPVSSPGYYSGSTQDTDTVGFQLSTTASTPAGVVAQKTITLTYDRQ